MPFSHHFAFAGQRFLAIVGMEMVRPEVRRPEHWSVGSPEFFPPRG